MKDTVGATGTRGLMKVQDNGDGTDKTVDLYLASSLAVAIPAVPWSYSIDKVVSETSTFNFVATTAWQHVAKIFVGTATEFIFHIEDTGHVELGGPTDLKVTPLLGAPTPADPASIVYYANVKVDGVYKKAIPYVNVAGVWKQAIPMVMDNSTWKAVT